MIFQPNGSYVISNKKVEPTPPLPTPPVKSPLPPPPPPLPPTLRTRFDKARPTNVFNTNPQLLVTPPMQPDDFEYPEYPEYKKEREVQTDVFRTKTRFDSAIQTIVPFSTGTTTIAQGEKQDRKKRERKQKEANVQTPSVIQQLLSAANRAEPKTTRFESKPVFPTGQESLLNATSTPIIPVAPAQVNTTDNRGGVGTFADDSDKWTGAPAEGEPEPDPEPINNQATPIMELLEDETTQEVQYAGDVIEDTTTNPYDEDVTTNADSEYESVNPKMKLSVPDEMIAAPKGPRKSLDYNTESKESILKQINAKRKKLTTYKQKKKIADTQKEIAELEQKFENFNDI